MPSIEAEPLVKFRRKSDERLLRVLVIVQQSSQEQTTSQINAQMVLDGFESSRNTTATDLFFWLQADRLEVSERDGKRYWKLA